MNGKMTTYAAGFVLSVCATTLVLAGGLLISGTGALADEGFALFGNIASPREQPAAVRLAAPRSADHPPLRFRRIAQPRRCVGHRRH